MSVLVQQFCFTHCSCQYFITSIQKAFVDFDIKIAHHWLSRQYLSVLPYIFQGGLTIGNLLKKILLAELIFNDLINSYTFTIFKPPLK